MRLLLHTCCGPCALYPAGALIKQGYAVTLFFYNPNIQPEVEYYRRLDELKKYLPSHGNLRLIEGRYEPLNWLSAVKGLANEPERGKRCELCYEYRLAATAQLTAEKNFDYFGSTLSISPHKDAHKINSLGEMLAEKFAVKFFVKDWKKNDGFKTACQLAREANFYRQNYCGCIFSRRATPDKKLA